MAPTIQAEREEFGEQWLDAVADSDDSFLTKRLYHFLQTPNLPPYYRMKTRIALSAAHNGDEPWEKNNKACEVNLKEAEVALAECKNVYKEVKDVELLDWQEEIIKEEWEGSRERERAAENNDSN